MIDVEKFRLNNLEETVQILSQKLEKFRLIFATGEQMKYVQESLSSWYIMIYLLSRNDFLVFFYS